MSSGYVQASAAREHGGDAENGGPLVCGGVGSSPNRPEY